MDSLRAFTFLPAIPAAPDGEDGDVRATPRPRQGTTGERSHPPRAHPVPPTNVTRMCNSFLKGASCFPPSPLPAGFSKQREGERGMNKISP